MIELRNNELIIRFPEVHKDAVSQISFKRTLRIPDDGSEYPMPADIGKFPLVHIEDYSKAAPKVWLDRGGVLIPMYQSEALWIDFSGSYPMAIKIAAGKINSVSGKAWSNELVADPQDYIVSDRQPRLDGFCVKRGFIKQFVAMPLGEGYSAEEQLTDKADFGGLQIIAYPMKAEVYEEILAKRLEEPKILFSRCVGAEESAMGFAPGGLMKQSINEDYYGINAWDMEQASRCFIHLVNSEAYESLTGHTPPHQPISKKRYKEQGMPWFDYYAEGGSELNGSTMLDKLKSIISFSKSNDDVLWDNDSMNVGSVKVIDAESKSHIVAGKTFLNR